MKAARKTAGRKNTRHHKVRESDRAITNPITSNRARGLLVDELRTQVLTLKRGNLPIVGSPRGSLYGLVIETALADRVTSLVVLSDGSTSWYVSTGHGCLGCGEDDEVNQAAKHLAAQAIELIVDAPLAQETAPPAEEATRLFLLTVDGLKLIDTQAAPSTSSLTTDALVALLLNAQRLLQLIERRGAGVSLEQHLAT